MRTGPEPTDKALSVMLHPGPFNVCLFLSHMDDNYMIGYCSMSRMQAKEND